MKKTTLSTMLFFSLIVLVAVALAGCLSVDKTGDKTVYAKGDTIVFTITVTNPTPTTVENVNLVDYPPPKITMGTTTVNIGNMAPGATVVSELTGTADEEGCELQNNVIATGSIEGQSNLNGGDTFTFDIGANCGSINTPEFPSLFLPAVMIIGFLSAVLLIQRTREN